jgi:hypothetical protein
MTMQWSKIRTDGYRKEIPSVLSQMKLEQSRESSTANAAASSSTPRPTSQELLEQRMLCWTGGGTR